MSAGHEAFQRSFYREQGHRMVRLLITISVCIIIMATGLVRAEDRKLTVFAAGSLCEALGAIANSGAPAAGNDGRPPPQQQRHREQAGREQQDRSRFGNVRAEFSGVFGLGILSPVA